MMRDLAIAYSNSRQAKKWSNKTVKFDDLKERLKTTMRTTKSVEEYAKMSKAQRDAAKDHGGFVAGVLKNDRRKVAPEEFVAISRYIAQDLGIDYFDECSYQPNQLMYWPSTPSNGVYAYRETDKGWFDPDAVLAAHPEWTDPTQLPTSSRESKANTTAYQKVQNPLEKEGVVGLFNRAFCPVTKAIDLFLSDIYESTDNPARYHLIEASSMAGVEIIEDKFVYSHHAKDAAYLRLCNAFDIVRMHRFGDLDDKASFKAMCDFAMQQDDVKVLAANEKLK